MQPRQRSKCGDLGRRCSSAPSSACFIRWIRPRGRVHLLAPQHVGRAGGQAEPAVHAVASISAPVDSAACVAARVHVEPPPGRRIRSPAKRPGAAVPGSNWSLTPRISGRPAPAPTGPPVAHRWRRVSTARRHRAGRRRAGGARDRRSREQARPESRRSAPRPGASAPSTRTARPAPPAATAGRRRPAARAGGRPRAQHRGQRGRPERDPDPCRPAAPGSRSPHQAGASRRRHGRPAPSSSRSCAARSADPGRVALEQHRDAAAAGAPPGQSSSTAAAPAGEPRRRRPRGQRSAAGRAVRGGHVRGARRAAGAAGTWPR